MSNFYDNLVENLRNVFTNEHLNEMSAERAQAYFETLSKHALYYYEIKFRGLDTNNTIRSLNTFMSRISKETNDITGKSINKIRLVSDLFDAKAIDGADKLLASKYSDIHPLRSTFVLQLMKRIDSGLITLEDMGFKWVVNGNKVNLTFAPIE